MRPSSVRVECPTVRMDGVDSDDLTALLWDRFCPFCFSTALTIWPRLSFSVGKEIESGWAASYLDREPSDIHFRSGLPLSTLRFRSIEWCSLSGIAYSEPACSCTKCIRFKPNSGNHSWADWAGVAGTRESRQVQPQKTTRFYNWQENCQYNSRCRTGTSRLSGEDSTVITAHAG